MNIQKVVKRTRRVSSFLGALLIMISVIFPTVVHAHDAYYLSVTIDPDSQQFVGIVAQDKNDIGANNHAEVKNTGVAFAVVGDGKAKSYIPNNTKSGTIDLTTKKGDYSDVLVNDKTEDEILLFSFPGVHVPSVGGGGKKRDGDGMDRQQAQWVSRNLVGGLNDAITYIHNTAYPDGVNDSSQLMETAIQLADAGALVAGVNGASAKIETFTINGVKFTVSDGSDVKGRDSDIPANHYVAVYQSDRKSQAIYVPWAVPKGYGANQRLAKTIENTSYEKTAAQDAKWLSWSHVVMQGVYNAKVLGVEYSGADKLNPPGIIERTLTGLITSVFDMLGSLLGLHSLPELMLNRGSYLRQNFKGVMPLGLADVADYVHLFVQFIAWMLLAGAFVKLLVQSNLSAINPNSRTNLMEGAMDIIGAGFVLIGFIPIFRSLLTINEALVQYFGGISSKVDLFGTIGMTGGGYLAGALVSIVMLVVAIYMNIQYIMRGITIAALYVFAPFFIVSIAYGSKFKEMFSTFMKELVGLIFMQSIHALLLAMYSLAFFKGASVGMLYTLVLSASFIPITKFIRNDMLGMKESMSGSLGSQAVSAGVGFATGAASNMMMDRSFEKANAESKGNGGFNIGGFEASDGGGGGGKRHETIESMLDNDARGEGNIGSTPAHYAGGGESFTAKLTPDIEEGKEASHNFGEKIGATFAKTKEGVQSASNKFAEVRKDSPALDKSLKVGGSLAKGAAKGAAMGAVIAAEAGIESNGMSQGLTQIGRASRMGKQLSGRIGSGGGSSSQSSGGTYTPIPDHSLLENYEVNHDQSGFVVSGGKENGDIVNIHNTESLMNSSGYEEMMDNGDYLLGKTNVSAESSPDLNQMIHDFESGDANKQAHWQGQGIDFVKKTDDGKALIGYNKQNLGINHFENDGTYTKFDMKPQANKEFFKYDSLKPREEKESKEAII